MGIQTDAPTTSAKPQTSQGRGLGLPLRGRRVSSWMLHLKQSIVCMMSRVETGSTARARARAKSRQSQGQKPPRTSTPALLALGLLGLDKKSLARRLFIVTGRQPSRSVRVVAPPHFAATIPGMAAAQDGLQKPAHPPAPSCRTVSPPGRKQAETATPQCVFSSRSPYEGVVFAAPP